MSFEESTASKLSFVTKTDSQTDFWSLETSGDYADDCRRGREAAIEWEKSLFFGEIAAPLLGSVVRSMIQKGRYGGLEAGFFQQIAEELSPVDQRRFSNDR